MSRFLLVPTDRHIHNVPTCPLPEPSLTKNEMLACWLQRESPVLYEFQVIKRLDVQRQERERTLCLTKDYCIEKSGDEVIGVHRYEVKSNVILS